MSKNNCLASANSECVPDEFISIEYPKIDGIYATVFYFTCKCGKSGSIIINPNDIRWEDE